MTREEAINKVRVYLTDYLSIDDYEEIDEIIKAIEQPCKDAVSRQAILEWIKESVELYANTYSIDMLNMWMLFEEQIKAMPSVTPVTCIAEFRFSKEDMQEIVDEKFKELTVERKKGFWIDTNDYITTAYGHIDYVKCSCCGEESLEEGDYCPNCGAEMQEVEE